MKSSGAANLLAVLEVESCWGKNDKLKLKGSLIN